MIGRLMRGAALATVIATIVAAPAAAFRTAALGPDLSIVTAGNADGEARHGDKVKPDKANRPDKKTKPEKAKPEKAKPEKAKPEKAKPEKAKPEKADKQRPEKADKHPKPDKDESHGKCHGIQHAFGRVTGNHGALMGHGNAVNALQAVADKRGCDLSAATRSPN